MLRIDLIGNLGRDPEMRSTNNGKTVCGFTVAVQQRRNGEDETVWVKVAAFDKLAENCSKYLAKGKKVYVSGTPSAHGWTNKEGNPAAQLEVIAREVEFLSPRSEGGASAAGAAQPGDGFVQVTDEELPF